MPENPKEGVEGMADSSLCCLEARREREPGVWGRGWAALSLSLTDPWAAPEGSSVYARGCHLYGYYPDAYSMVLFTAQVEAVLGTDPSRVASALWLVTFITTM